MSEKKLKEEEALQNIVKALETLGWSMSIPSVADDSEVPGMVVGKVEYIDFITEHLPDDMNWNDEEWTDCEDDEEEDWDE